MTVTRRPQWLLLARATAGIGGRNLVQRRRIASDLDYGPISLPFSVHDRA
jgi:hypothetical protein